MPYRRVAAHATDPRKWAKPGCHDDERDVEWCARGFAGLQEDGPNAGAIASPYGIEFGCSTKRRTSRERTCGSCEHSGDGLPEPPMYAVHVECAWSGVLFIVSLSKLIRSSYVMFRVDGIPNTPLQCGLCLWSTIRHLLFPALCLSPFQLKSFYFPTAKRTLLSRPLFSFSQEIQDI